MKNWVKAAEIAKPHRHFTHHDHYSAVLRAFGIDPDAEYIEPAKPEAARWWEIGESVPARFGWCHTADGIVIEFVVPTTLSTHRWHGPHATEEAAREHYETSKAYDDLLTPDRAGRTPEQQLADHRELKALLAKQEAHAAAQPQPAPQPEAEYDAGWVGEYWLTHTVQQTAAEAARREWEKIASNIITLQNKVEAARVQLATCGAVARGAFCPSEGSLGWSDSLGAVRDLHAERDRLAAELAAVKLQPSADLAGEDEYETDFEYYVRRARIQASKAYNEVASPVESLLCDAVMNLAQAVAGMGGGK